MNGSYDLIVIGGGPAGTSAAITAARGGHRVLLLERGRFPRHKVCGEFVSAESLALLQWLIADAGPALFERAVPIHESRILMDGRTIRVPIHRQARSIARYDLDFALWNAARNAGVTAVSDTAVQHVEGTGPFQVRTATGEFQGRAIVNATGRWSNLKRMEASLDEPRWLGLKAHFEGETSPSVDLYFFHHGYCGVQPVLDPTGRPCVNVCALFQTNEKPNWSGLFARHPQLAQNSRNWRPLFGPLSTFPVVFRPPEAISGNMFNAGDAAGFVDPFVGDGIALALRGGNMAASSASTFFSGDQTLPAALQQYGRAYRQHLRPVYRASSVIRNCLALPSVIRKPLLSACEHAPIAAEWLLKMTRSRASIEQMQASKA